MAPPHSDRFVYRERENSSSAIHLQYAFGHADSHLVVSRTASLGRPSRPAALPANAHLCGVGPSLRLSSRRARRAGLARNTHLLPQALELLLGLSIVDEVADQRFKIHRHFVVASYIFLQLR